MASSASVTMAHGAHLERGGLLVHWHDLPELWEDLTRGFPAFRHLGVQRLEEGIRTSRTTFPG
jgi:hypothetical protein